MSDSHRLITSCFIGSRLEALQVLQLYTQVKSIIVTKDSWLHKHCMTNGIPAEIVSKEQKEHIFESLSNQEVDLVLSAGFPYIIPAFVFKKSATKFVNSHPALLPNYKGYRVIDNAFHNREAYMGVTVHEMVEEVDTGPIIWQEKVWVENLNLESIYQLIFSIIEPIAIIKSMEKLILEGHFLKESL